MFALSLSGGKLGAYSLFGFKVEMCPGVRPERWLRWFAHPLGDVYRGHPLYPAFVPCSSKVAVGFFFFFFLVSVSFIQNLPQLHAGIFSPM